MKLFRNAWPYMLLVGISWIFFYKTVFLGLLPFPGDLLLSEYNPWRHASYDGYVPGAIPSKVQYFDVIRELYPWKYLAIDEIKRGRLPLWNPYNFSGSPLMANHQSAIFYPLNFLYFLLPFDIAWSVLVVLQPILGSMFFFLFASTIGISPWGAILGAIAFNYGSFANVWMEFNTVWHTILWLPLILWCVEKRKTMLLAFAVFASATAGHPQDFLYVFGFSVVYAVARIFVRHPLARQEDALRVVLGFLGGLGLAAFQILPTIELFHASARVQHDYQFVINSMLIPPWQLIKIFVADFFGNPATKTYFLNDTYVNTPLSVGLIGIMLAVSSLLTSSTSWHRKFFLWTGFVVLLLTVRTPITEIFYKHPIPILATGSPTRLLSLLAISLAVLGGFGWDTVTNNRKLFLRASEIVGLILIIGWINAVALSSATTVRAMVLATITFVAGFIAILVIPNKWRALTVVSVLALELLFAFLKFNPFVPRSFVFPSHPLWDFLRSRDPLDRFWGYGTAYVLPNVSTMYRLQSPDGIDPLNLKTYNQFVQASSNGLLARSFTRTTRSDAGVAGGFGEQDLPKNLTRLRVLDALGVHYVIDRQENATTAVTFPPDRFTPVWKDNGWTVFKNTKAAPRYFLTHDVLRYQSIQEFETLFVSDDFNPSQTVLVSNQYELPKLTADSTKTIKLVRHEQSLVSFQTSTEQPQLFYLSDADDGNWRASIDGKNAPIIRANWAFRGVLVPAGNHSITFTYLPHSFRLGLSISIITILLLFTYAHFSWRPKRKM